MVWAVSSALEDFFESILFIAKISTDLAVAAVAAKAPPQFVAFQPGLKFPLGSDFLTSRLSQCLKSVLNLRISPSTLKKTKLYKMEVTRPAKKPRENLLGF